jgi:Ser/Thr protein kinase RdoA (MazF antagonist)
MRPVVESFFSLTPDRVLESVEEGGVRTTGLCYALNSLENRVYEVELEDGRRLIGKFYRPGRWSEATILDEHRLLQALAEAEIPVAAPVPLGDGATLGRTPDGIFYGLFPKVGGRSPDDLSLVQLEQIGRLLGRIHNVAGALSAPHRPALSPQTYGHEALAQILAHPSLDGALRQRYEDAARRFLSLAERRWQGVQASLIHADCHRGNLLHGRDGWFFLDFDDAAFGPPVQDLWLLLPGRPADCPEEVEALVRGYELFRPFPRQSLGLIEVLRGLRYVRYAGWVARRWDDPAFVRAFPDWGSERYWQQQTADLHEQLRLSEGDTG